MNNVPFPLCDICEFPIVVNHDFKRGTMFQVIGSQITTHSIYIHDACFKEHEEAINARLAQDYEKYKQLIEQLEMDEEE